MAVDGAKKLAIYNGALRRLGEGPLAALTENRQPRRVLDGIWGGSNEIVRLALERGEWNFAIRTVEGVPSESVEPPFGFTLAYDKPDDFRRLAALSGDDRFTTTLMHTQYMDEAGYWFTDIDPIYIRYVSDDTDYGMNSGAWTEVFRDYLECDLAWGACEQITNGGSKRDRLERDRAKALTAAKSHDAMQEGVKFPPRGAWATSRAGWGNGWGNR